MCYTFIMQCSVEVFQHYVKVNLIYIIRNKSQIHNCWWQKYPVDRHCAWSGANGKYRNFSLIIKLHYSFVLNLEIVWFTKVIWDTISAVNLKILNWNLMFSAHNQKTTVYERMAGAVNERMPAVSCKSDVSLKTFEKLTYFVFFRAVCCSHQICI